MSGRDARLGHAALVGSASSPLSRGLPLALLPLVPHGLTQVVPFPRPVRPLHGIALRKGVLIPFAVGEAAYVGPATCTSRTFSAEGGLEATGRPRATGRLEATAGLWHGQRVLGIATTEPCAPLSIVQLEAERLDAAQPRRRCSGAVGFGRQLQDQVQKVLAVRLHRLCSRVRGLLRRALHDVHDAVEGVGVLQHDLARLVQHEKAA
mmetsp:Transcript_94970/g.245307  ORF Transcript_94970/g.245307 Transcript_94970/m.245307 type:complete len:207 (+) Transcript_94970:109-729(+)